MHIRNRAGHTPLFLAAQAGQSEYVHLLREAGAHLHSEEVGDAKHLAKRSGGDETQGPSKLIWQAAGVEL